MTASLGADWLARADADIDAVGRCLAGESANVEVACYHCQQAAEKLVKALLVHAGIRYPRGKEGHDMALCASLLPQSHPLRAQAVAFDDITVWATAFRYPADDPMTAEPLPDPAEVARWLARIERFREATVRIITAPPMPDPSSA